MQPLKNTDDQTDTRKGMETENSQNQEKVLATNSSNNISKSKDENVVAGNSPSCWKSWPNFIFNMTELLERAKSYAHLIKERF